MRFRDISENKELDLPTIEVGDEVKVGKFKNRKATITGFTKDEHNQPVLKTTKGDQKLFKPRISKLEEGLIAIPPKMRETIHRLVIKNILWYAISEFKRRAGDGRSFASHMPEQYKAFKKLAAEYGVDIPKTKYDSKKVIAYYVKFNLEGMDPSYQKNAEKEQDIRFAISWDHSMTNRTGAGWMPEEKILLLRPKALPYFMHYPTPKSHPDDLAMAIKSMLESIDHELRHIVQFMAIRHDDQTRFNPGYEQRRDNYLTSPVEFDPQIGSKVHEFLELWLMTDQAKALDKNSLVRAMKKFTAVIPSGRFDTFKAHELFTALKARSVTRYKIAVKKFVLEVQKQLSDIPVKESAEPLTEGRDAYLFHGSPLISALGILKSGDIAATQDYDHSPMGVSLSRDYKMAMDFGTFWDRQYPVIFVFNQAKIVQKLKLEPFLDSDTEGTPREKEFEEMYRGDLPLEPYLVSINVSPSVIAAAAKNPDWMDQGIEENRWFNNGPSNRKAILQMLKVLANHPLLNKWNHRVYDKIEQPTPVNTFLPRFHHEDRDAYIIGGMLYCNIEVTGKDSASIVEFYPDGILAQRGGEVGQQQKDTATRFVADFVKQAAKAGVTITVSGTY